MKNIVRAFVVVLALTGAAASSQITSSSNTASSNAIVVSKTSALPIPDLPPQRPQGLQHSRRLVISEAPLFVLLNRAK